MDEKTQEHFDGFKTAVNNNQLYLAMQHLSEFMEGFVNAEEEEVKTTETKSASSGRKPTRKTTAKAKDEETAD